MLLLRGRRACPLVLAAQSEHHSQKGTSYTLSMCRECGAKMLRTGRESLGPEESQLGTEETYQVRFEEYVCPGCDRTEWGAIGTEEKAKTRWAVGHPATMASDKGTLPWVELCEQVSGMIFNAYRPPTLVGELSLRGFGAALLGDLDAKLSRELLALELHQEHSISWTWRGETFPTIRFKRKA